MATPADQLNQLLSTTLDTWRPKLMDQTIKKSSVLAALESKAKITVQGGNTIRQPLMYALNDTVKFYDGYDLFDTTPQGGIGNAIYPWKQLGGTVTISGKERRINNGPEAFIDLVNTKFQQLEASFIRKFNEALFDTAPTAKAFNSLVELVGNADPSRGALGGIDAATETWWQSIVESGPVDLTTTAGVKQLNNVANRLWVNGSMPDFEFTTQANFEAYEALATEKIRFTDTKMGDLGFQAIAHKTAEVIFDPFVPAPGGSGGGYWYFVNTDFIEFVRHSQAWMTRLDTQRPYNQDAWTTPVICMGNLVTGMRRAHAVITNVDVTP
jgi:hypothetical protein